MSTSQRRRILVLLLSLSLLASVVHFADNAARLDLYPGPVWLTPRAILLAWCVLPLLAWTAYRLGTQTALIAYALIGFVGLAHFLLPHRMMTLRCYGTVLGEVVTSLLLIGFVLFFPKHVQERSYP